MVGDLWIVSWALSMLPPVKPAPHHQYEREWDLVMKNRIPEQNFMNIEIWLDCCAHLSLQEKKTRSPYWLMEKKRREKKQDQIFCQQNLFFRNIFVREDLIWSPSSVGKKLWRLWRHIHPKTAQGVLPTYHSWLLGKGIKNR